MKDVLIYDTTLRDGCQAEDISFTLEDKLRIAEALGGDIPHEVLLPDQFLQTAGDHYGDQIVLDPIEHVQLMPGTSTSLVLHLTSTRPQATECRVRLEAPLGAAVEPRTASVTIEAFADAQVPARVRTTDTAEGKFLTVRLDFVGRSLEQKLTVRHLAPVEHLPEGLSLCSVWEASRLSHNTGISVDDPEAYAGQGWQVVPAKHRAETHLAWGPPP